MGEVAEKCYRPIGKVGRGGSEVGASFSKETYRAPLKLRGFESLFSIPYLSFLHSAIISFHFRKISTHIATT